MAEEKLSRRDALRKLAGWGVGAAAVGVLGGCATKPPEGLARNPRFSDNGAIHTQRIQLHQEPAIVYDRHNNRYRVWVITARPYNTPVMDCAPEPFENRRRPMIFGGLLRPLLEGAHNATQSLKSPSCDFYDNAVAPVTGAIGRTIDNALLELNKYEVSPYLYGSQDVNGHVIRPAEDPNRIIVIQPWFVQHSSVNVPKGPSNGQPRLA